MAPQKLISEIGRRKCASARVRIAVAEEGESKIIVNDLDVDKYFSTPAQRQDVIRPLVVTERLGKYSFLVNVRGGGKGGQAGAVRLGIARALQNVEPELRAALKKAGYLRRDPRVVERKKAGRHKARKSTQFSKR